MQPQATSARPSRNLVKGILIAGFIAGTLDIIAAIISSGADPIRVLQFIASGAVGRDAAFAGGLPMAFLGLALHYLIAYSWTTLFFLLYPKLCLFIFSPCNRNIIPVRVRETSPAGATSGRA